MTKLLKPILAFFYLIFATNLLATTAAHTSPTTQVSMYFTTGNPAGSILITETKYGLLITPNLHGLIPGKVHGFHIHDKPSCKHHGMAAGGHFDPQKTDKHLGPYTDKGHLGDLPALYVNPNGTVTLPVLAPRIKHLSDIKNHALIIHQKSDNYSDTPEKLGGGGERMICSTIL